MKTFKRRHFSVCTATIPQFIREKDKLEGMIKPHPIKVRFV